MPKLSHEIYYFRALITVASGLVREASYEHCSLAVKLTVCETVSLPSLILT